MKRYSVFYGENLIASNMTLFIACQLVTILLDNQHFEELIIREEVELKR